MKIGKRYLVWPVAGALALVMSPGADAARLGPPSDFLVKAPHLIVVVKAQEKLDGPRVVFERLDVLLGENVPEQIVVRVDDETFTAVEPGQRYLLGFRILRPVPRSRTLFEKDPEGPRAVRLPGMGDALLDDTPEIRRLVLAAAEAGTAERRASPRQLLDAVLTQLVRAPALSVRFVAAELLFRPELQELVEPKDIEIIRKRLRTLAPDPFSRYLLFEAASTLAERQGGVWLAAECRQVLASQGTELDLGSSVPALLVVAARALAKTGVAKDLGLLEKHLMSNNPGVAKASLAAMATLDPSATIQVVTRVLEKGGLHTESRRALEAHRRLHGPPAGL